MNKEQRVEAYGPIAADGELYAAWFEWWTQGTAATDANLNDPRIYLKPSHTSFHVFAAGWLAAKNKPHTPHAP
jgi:hypothetical protein